VASRRERRAWGGCGTVGGMSEEVLSEYNNLSVGHG
jgi:hypothetical protein